MKLIPVNVISGFLGSGKTTAIIELLAKNKHQKKWAVLVNEFGKISIDSETINAASNGTSIYDIAGGCICCSAKDYFLRDLKNIANSGKYNRIIIEPSGLGGIDMVKEIVQSIPCLHLLPVTCLIDITGIENAGLQRNPIYQSQIRKADYILPNKLDLISDPNELKRMLKILEEQMPPGKRLLENKLSLFNLMLSNKNEKEQVKNEAYRLHLNLPDEKNTKIARREFTFPSNQVFNIDSLNSLFTNSGSILRAKGYLNTNCGWRLFNLTLTQQSFAPCSEQTENTLVVLIPENKLPELSNISQQLDRATF